MGCPGQEAESFWRPWKPPSVARIFDAKCAFVRSEQNFDPRFRAQGGSGFKKMLTNRFGHEFCVRPEFFRSFGDVFGKLSRIHFAKSKGVVLYLICTTAARMNSIIMACSSTPVRQASRLRRRSARFRVNHRQFCNRGTFVRI